MGFASKTGLFNIGASGQVYRRGIRSSVCRCTFYIFTGCSSLDRSSFSSDSAGALWGMVPGILKATRNVNVVIGCIMMNYIGMYSVNALGECCSIYDPLAESVSSGRRRCKFFQRWEWI